MRRNVIQRFPILLAVVALLLVTAWFYAPTIKFGFMWDDPIWFSRVIGKSLLELVGPTPDYQFYRPGTMLYNRLFLKADNTLDAPLLHLAQIGWHLLTVALVYAVCCRLRLGGGASLAVSALVACFPFSYQAVAWAAPQQPLVTALQFAAWLTYLQARKSSSRWTTIASALFFLLALTVQEGTVLMAVVPLLLEWTLRQKTKMALLGLPGKHPERSETQSKGACPSTALRSAQDAFSAKGGRATKIRSWRGVPWLALGYLFITLGYGLFWLAVPRRAGFTSWNFQTKALLYFLQGFIFPILGRPQGYEPGQTLEQNVLMALTGVTVVALLGMAWRAGRIRHAILGVAIAVLGSAPSAIGLRYSYVSVSPRLFYYAAPGVALLWVCALVPPLGATLARRVWRIVGLVLMSLIVLQSGLVLGDFQRVYASGTAHIAELVQAAQGETRMLFVNFPDRYAPKRAPYPVGYWGVTLAPISVDLGTFPAIVSGQQPKTLSRSMPWLDAEAREAGPYRVDMRGEITPAEQFYQLARQGDTVYVSRYFADGTYALERAGAIVSTGSDAACQPALFGQAICLQAIEVKLRPGQLTVLLTWQSMAAAQPHDTMFAHVGPPGQPPLAQADGDAWLGLLPLEVWQPGDVIREERFVPLPQDAPPNCEIRIGLYNRLAGERLPATTLPGEPLPGNAFTIQLTNDQ